MQDYLLLVFIVYSVLVVCVCCDCYICFFQAEDGIRVLVRSRGLGDVYKRQGGVYSICKEMAYRGQKTRGGVEVRWGFFGAIKPLSLIHI